MNLTIPPWHIVANAVTAVGLAGASLAKVQGADPKLVAFGASLAAFAQVVLVVASFLGASSTTPPPASPTLPPPPPPKP